jgi:hypothetical protein
MDKAPPQVLTLGPQEPLAAHDAVLRCQAALLARPGLAQGATALAAELAELLHCRRASVGLLEGERLRIVGSSQPSEIDARHETAAAITAAMQEAIDQRQSVAWPPTQAHAPISLAQRQLAGSAQACSVPVVVNSVAIGAITLERDTGEPFWPAQLALCEDVASFAGPVLELKRTSDGGAGALARQRAGAAGGLGAARGGRRHRRLPAAGQRAPGRPRAGRPGAGRTRVAGPGAGTPPPRERAAPARERLPRRAGPQRPRRRWWSASRKAAEAQAMLSLVEAQLQRAAWKRPSTAS